jgi:hypothetical protein
MLRNMYRWFSWSKLYRKWYGGKWECWWTDVIYRRMWYNELTINTYHGKPSVLARQLVKTENWRK